MARPRKQVDPETVFELSKIGASQEEMSHVLRCSTATLGRRFLEEIERGRAEMKMSLRRKQLEVALDGNPSMLIWLGKQLLGQSDKSRAELASEVDRAITTRLATLSAEEQNARLQKLLAKAGFHLEAAPGRAERSPTPDGLPEQTAP